MLVRALWRVLRLDVLLRLEVDRYFAQNPAPDASDYWVDIDERVECEINRNFASLIEVLNKQPGG